MNITLYDYLASNVPNDCIQLLNEYEYPSSENELELVEDLKSFVRAYGHEALEQLGTIHPDRDLISTLSEASTPYEGKKDSDFVNAAGTIDRISNIEKSMMNKTVETSNDILNKNDIILGLGVAILTATLFRSK
jgi:hypothetical protein